MAVTLRYQGTSVRFGANLGGTADMNSSQWGEFVSAVFFVTIQSRGNLHKFANHACMNERSFLEFHMARSHIEMQRSGIEMGL